MGEEETEWMATILRKVDKCKRGDGGQIKLVSALVTARRESFVAQVSPCPILCKHNKKK